MKALHPCNVDKCGGQGEHIGWSENLKQSTVIEGGSPGLEDPRSGAKGQLYSREEEGEDQGSSHRGAKKATVVGMHLWSGSPNRPRSEGYELGCSAPEGGNTHTRQHQRNA